MNDINATGRSAVKERVRALECIPPAPVYNALQVARAIANNSNCERRHVGCVLLDSEYRILSAESNGSIAPPVCERPEEQGNCGCVHAEVRAAVHRSDARRAYYAVCLAAPCGHCAKVLLEIGVTTVYFVEDSHPGQEGAHVIERGGGKIYRIMERSASSQMAARGSGPAAS